MRGALLAIAVLMTAVLSGCSGKLLTTTQILDVDSTLRLDPTGSFTVGGAWDLKYTFDCSSQQSQRILNAGQVTLTVFDSDDDSLNFEHPKVTATGRSGGARLHFTRGGTFYVLVETVCSWRVVVVDLNGA
jgi:hypothetical protein